LAPAIAAKFPHHTKATVLSWRLDRCPSEPLLPSFHTHAKGEGKKENFNVGKLLRFLALQWKATKEKEKEKGNVPLPFMLPEMSVNKLAEISGQ
jgi:hypothetical protein